MSDYGMGAFHVHYVANDGREFRKAYRTFDDASKARDFLEALGIFPTIDMHKKKREWDDDDDER